MLESFRQAAGTLAANRLRTTLGALAIAVAVATQDIVSAAPDGVAASLVQQLRDVGVALRKPAKPGSA